MLLHLQYDWNRRQDQKKLSLFWLGCVYSSMVIPQFWGHTKMKFASRSMVSMIFHLLATSNMFWTIHHYTCRFPVQNIQFWGFELNSAPLNRMLLTASYTATSLHHIPKYKILLYYWHSVASHAAVSSPSAELLSGIFLPYPIATIFKHPFRMHFFFICLSKKKAKWIEMLFPVSLVEHVTIAVYT